MPIALTQHILDSTVSFSDRKTKMWNAILKTSSSSGNIASEFQA
uniref:Uncharacterized protein n=1 Tax=Arundo donax TaxID=35708 RepID=A0A0A9H6P0_ARUDO